MVKSNCCKCGEAAELYPVNFEGCRSLCLTCRWQLVYIHRRASSLSLPFAVQDTIFTKFFASRNGYNNIMLEIDEIEKYVKESS